MNLNKVFIIGRLTGDPEVKTTPMGNRVTVLNVATNRVWNDKSGAKKEASEFHRVVLWARLADIAGQFLVKGSEIFIEGRIQTRSWQGKDGNTRWTTEIIGERMQLGARPSSSRNYGETRPASESASAGVDSDDAGFSLEESTGGEVPVIEIEDGGEIKPEDLPF
jgi:single-strand DNA-binding protein